MSHNHDEESDRAARATHARMMRGDLTSLYVYYTDNRIEAFADEEAPPGWTLAWPEVVPGNKTVDQLVVYFANRTARLPYLKGEQ